MFSIKGGFFPPFLLPDLKNAVKSFGIPADNNIKENGLVIQSKRNRFSAGWLVLHTAGWCERDVTHVYQTGKELRVIRS